MQDFEKVYERPKNVIERSSYKLVHEALILCNHIMYHRPILKYKLKYYAWMYVHSVENSKFFYHSDFTWNQILGFVEEQNMPFEHI